MLRRICDSCRTGKIKDIVLQKVADLTGYNVVDLEGNYIMPGLINMHVHLAGNGKPQKKQRDNAKLVNFLTSNPLTRAIAHNMVSGFAEMELLSRCHYVLEQWVVLEILIHVYVMKLIVGRREVHVF